MTVEFVLMVPLLFLLILFLMLAGRAVEAHDQVDGAARDAARAASLARSAAQAQASADQAVSSDVHGWCSAPALTGFVPGSQAVAVTLHCSLNLGFISFGSLPLTGSAVAPLDSYVARTY